MGSVREQPIPLNPGIVDLWQVSLDPPAADVAYLGGLLTADERERAERYKFDHLRRRFVVGRGMLRMLLSRLVRRPPEQLVFSYGPHGKPALVTERGDAPIEFNVAHCEDVALFAFAVGRRLGVDVERARTFADMNDLANHYFAPEERRSLASVAVGQQEAAFYAGWTRKEAFIKATGEGLARELDSFAVTLAPQEPVRIVHVDGDTNAAQRWRLLAIALAPPFFGAVVAEGVDWTLRINTQSPRSALARLQP